MLHRHHTKVTLIFDRLLGLIGRNAACTVNVDRTSKPITTISSRSCG